jgi:hypothetical protein
VETSIYLPWAVPEPYLAVGGAKAFALAEEPGLGDLSKLAASPSAPTSRRLRAEVAHVQHLVGMHLASGTAALAWAQDAALARERSSILTLGSVHGTIAVGSLQDSCYQLGVSASIARYTRLPDYKEIRKFLVSSNMRFGGRDIW